MRNEYFLQTVNRTEYLEGELDSAWKNLDALKATLKEERDININLKFYNETLLAHLSIAGKSFDVDLENNFTNSTSAELDDVLIPQSEEFFEPKDWNADLRRELDTAKKEIDALKAELKTERNIRRKLENHNEILLAYLTTKEKSVDAVDNCRKIPEWVENNFSGKIIILNRAKDRLKDAEPKIIPLILDAFKVLETYWNMRNKLIPQTEFQKLLDEFHFVKEPTISDNRAGEQGDAYYVRDDNGKLKKLDWHLKRGCDRDKQEHFLRVYFYWDKARNLVVVGDMLKHLKTRQS